MNKRLISCILTVALLFGSFSIASADLSGLAEKVISIMLRLSKDERSNYFTAFKPLLASDSGIDVLISLVEGYNAESENLFSGTIGSLLKYTDKQTLKNALASFKVIEPMIRRKYLDSFALREDLNISGDSKQALQHFIDKTQENYNGLSTLMTEDNVTAQVIAKQLKAISEINDGKPLLTDLYEGGEDLDIFYLSPRLAENIGMYGSDKGADGNEVVLSQLAYINSSLTPTEKRSFKKLGEEIGFYVPYKNALPSGVKEGVVYKKEALSLRLQEVANKWEATNMITEGATVIEVASYVGDAKQQHGRLEQPVTIAVPVISNTAMAYRLDNALIPIKCSVCVDNTLFIRIEQTGLYAIMSKGKYFTDANGWGEGYIESLYNRGIINGKGEGVFAPEDNIKREEFVKLVIELFDIKDDKFYSNFTDVDQEQWYYPYVAIAFKNGIVNGVGDNRFGVGDNIQRQDICKILHNVMKIRNLSFADKRNFTSFKDNYMIDQYAVQSVELMYKAGIISGDDNGYFNPKEKATRQEAAKIIHGALEMYVKSSL